MRSCKRSHPVDKILHTEIGKSLQYDYISSNNWDILKKKW